jgi:AraC-like DNA-binding protein
VRFWRDDRHDGLECLTATFCEHRYRPHTHDTYVIGVIERGCESFAVNGTRHYAFAGDVCFVNPGEVHDGEPEGGGFSYRMTYPSVAHIGAIAEGILGRHRSTQLVFRPTVVCDPTGFELFRRAHRTLEENPDPLLVDEVMVEAYGYFIARYSTVSGAPQEIGRAPHGAARMRDFLEAHFDMPIDLQQLADISDISRHHAMRLFRRTFGITPHAYLTDVRVRRAEELLRSGRAPVEVATRCGFCDQSHLNRAFKARRGVTPATFAQR